jgi:hypothetical protein
MLSHEKDKVFGYFLTINISNKNLFKIPPYLLVQSLDSGHIGSALHNLVYPLPYIARYIGMYSASTDNEYRARFSYFFADPNP